MDLQVQRNHSGESSKTPVTNKYKQLLLLVVFACR